jgi:hypothetical protein|tara:strand:+ start:81 stop:386 length:306 start_codon:yes stop_codon:yes gene_type:complete
MEYGLYQGLSAASSPHTLVAQDSGGGKISSINICNAHASNAATVRLFLHDGTDGNDTSFVEGLVIPAGASLLLTEGLSFNDDLLALKIAITGTVDLNVIIK